MELIKNFGFQMSISFRKMFHVFQKSLIKSLIHKIKKHKNFHNFLTCTDRRNWKENVKNNKKIKKQIVNCGILKKKIISHIYIFVNELLEISKILW